MTPECVHLSSFLDLRAARYLKGTIDKELILNSSGKLKLDCYPDADFTG
jgi:hypothetical protein